MFDYLKYIKHKDMIVREMLMTALSVPLNKTSPMLPLTTTL